MVIIFEYNEQDDKPPSSSPVSPKPSNETKVEEAINATEEDKKAPNIGNDLDLDNYSCGQSVQEVKEANNTTEAIEENKKGILAPNIGNGLDLDNYSWDQFVQEVKEAINTTEAIEENKKGILEDQKSIYVLLTKIDKMNWWKWVVKGEPELDTEKVEPEITRLSELDPEIQSSVETIMFDQRQEAISLPTLDEMQNQEMLKFIMEKYPWMDFSRAKKSFS